MPKEKLHLKSKNILHIFIIIFEIFFVFIFCFSLYHIIDWLIDTKENKRIKNDIDKLIITPEDISKEEFKVDFNKLKEINPDTIAYIYVPGTNINYVVVKGNDNDYYLKHNFEKKWNIGGWIFGDYRNRFDGSDKNLIIYGHNMRDGSMFETLQNILDINWSNNDNNHNIILITENNKYTYKVFSTYSIKPEDYYLNTSFANEEDYKSFINSLKIRSYYDYKVDLLSTNPILTLSSCIGDGKKRVVLHAILDSEEKMIKENSYD